MSGVSASERTAVRRSGGRFVPRYDERTLLDVVAAVARAADPDEPGGITQRDYDAARSSAGYADAPTAKQTAARFRMSWRELLAFALAPMISPEIALGRQLGERNEDWLDEAAVRAALKTVALRLGKKTLRPADYLAEREAMLAEARLAFRHQREPLLPSEGQIERIAGGWDKALAIAGLKPRPPQTSGPTGVPIVVALELALEAHGCLLTRRELAAFAKANSFSLARRIGPWADYVSQLRAERADFGRWTPIAPPPLAVRPDYTKPVKLPASFAPVRRRRYRWTKKECVGSLAGLLAETGSERLTQRLYQQRRRSNPDLPPLTALQRQGGFGALMAQARKRSGIPRAQRTTDAR